MSGGSERGTTDKILDELGLQCLKKHESYHEASTKAYELINDAKQARKDVLVKLQEKDDKGYYYSAMNNNIVMTQKDKYVGGAYEDGEGIAWKATQEYLGQCVVIALTNGSFSEDHKNYYPITSEIVVSFVVESDRETDTHNIQLKRLMGMLDQYWFQPSVLVLLLTYAMKHLNNTQWSYVRAPVAQLLDTLDEILLSVAWNNMVQGSAHGYDKEGFSGQGTTKLQEWCTRFMTDNGLFMDEILEKITNDLLIKEEEKDKENKGQKEAGKDKENEEEEELLRLRFSRIKFQSYVDARKQSLHKFSGIDRQWKGRQQHQGVGLNMASSAEGSSTEMPTMVWDYTNKARVHEKTKVHNMVLTESGLYVPETWNLKTTKIYQTQTSINEWAMDADEYLAHSSGLYDSRMIRMKNLYFDNEDPEKNIRPTQYVNEICLAKARDSTYNEGSKMLSIQHKLSPKHAGHGIATIVVADIEKDERWVHVSTLNMGKHYNESNFVCSFIELAVNTVLDHNYKNPFWEDASKDGANIRMTEYDSMRISKSLYFYWGVLLVDKRELQVGMSVESLRHLPHDTDVIHITKRLKLPGIDSDEEMNSAGTLLRWISTQINKSIAGNLNPTAQRIMVKNTSMNIAKNFSIGPGCTIEDKDMLYRLAMKTWWCEGDGRKMNSNRIKRALSDMKREIAYAESEIRRDHINYAKWLFWATSTYTSDLQGPADKRKTWIFVAIAEQKDMDMEPILREINRRLSIQNMVKFVTLNGYTQKQIQEIRVGIESIQELEKQLRQTKMHSWDTKPYYVGELHEWEISRSLITETRILQHKYHIQNKQGEAGGVDGIFDETKERAILKDSITKGRDLRKQKGYKPNNLTHKQQKWKKEEEERQRKKEEEEKEEQNRKKNKHEWPM